MLNFHPWYSLTEDQIIEEIGKRIKQIRLNINMSQRELAEHIGTDHTEISRIEKGKPVTMKTFLRILRVLNKLENIDKAIAIPPINPNVIRKLEGNKRKRARKNN